MDTTAIKGPEGAMLDIHRIFEILPHRYPFLLVDRIKEMRGDEEVVAIKNVSINEPFFQGHFPGRPVFPGVLQIEAVAQVAGILMLQRVGKEGHIALFMSCNHFKFRKAVVPGDQMEIVVKLVKIRQGRIGIAEGTCLVDGAVVSSGELMFGIAEDF